MSTLRAALFLAPIMIAACSSDATYRPYVDGDVERGKNVIRQYECGVCHSIPGIRGANGQVGPALDNYWRNVYVAGKFPNTPEYLTAWIIDAPSLSPRTAMPALGVNADEARDVAAYLYSL
jgi:cytochrome c